MIKCDECRQEERGNLTKWYRLEVIYPSLRREVYRLCSRRCFRVKLRVMWAQAEKQER